MTPDKPLNSLWHDMKAQWRRAGHRLPPVTRLERRREDEVVYLRRPSRALRRHMVTTPDSRRSA